MKIGIITVGYNRPHAIKRLLDSLYTAEYKNDAVDLIISIDKGELQSDIIEVAEMFEWNHGQKKIRTFSERQGLRPHIISCGDLTSEYDAVVVLEDDITVSPGFYLYAKQAIDFYDKDDKIAGISLYKHLINVGVSRTFDPANNGYDAYLMQFAQSWGQCWTKKMWEGFKAWYVRNSESIKLGDELPDNIIAWNEKSWMKYYMKYIVDFDKYFVYPQVSLTTNHSDVGQHCMSINHDYQVPILEGVMEYRFPTFKRAVKYDVFFERIDFDVPFLHGKKFCMDLYGNKKDFGDADILISTEARPYKVLRILQLKYRPHEVNCIYPVDGEGIFVYDLNVKAKLPLINRYLTARYDVKAIHWRKTLKHGLNGVISAFKVRFIK